jgi:hypothetical protein
MLATLDRRRTNTSARPYLRRDWLFDDVVA